MDIAGSINLFLKFLLLVLKIHIDLYSVKEVGSPTPRTLKKTSVSTQFLPARTLQEDVISSVTACIWGLPCGPQALGPWSGLRKCRDRVEVTILPVLTV